MRIGTGQGRVECWVARKAGKNQGGYIKVCRVEHNTEQGRDGKGENTTTGARGS